MKKELHQIRISFDDAKKQITQQEKKNKAQAHQIDSLNEKLNELTLQKQAVELSLEEELAGLRLELDETKSKNKSLMEKLKDLTKSVGLSFEDLAPDGRLEGCASQYTFFLHMKRTRIFFLL